MICCLRRNVVLVICFLVTHAAFGQNFCVKTSKPDAIYDIGDKAVFVVTVPRQGSLEYILSHDSKDILEKGSVDCKETTVAIEGMLDKPGFLYCEIKFTASDVNETKEAVAAAAFEPSKIVPAGKKTPRDFDDFWRKKKQELSEIPMNPVLTSVTSSVNSLAIYDVKVDCIGMPVRGYYVKPLNASGGGCPAIIFFQGAGVFSAAENRITEYGKEGFIAFEINAHGIPNGQSEEYYKNLCSTTLLNYQFKGKESRENCYFTGMFLRVMRALEFIKSQPEWDGKHLVAYGTSQGGAQAIAAAGLDSDVTFLFAGVPAMCDHGGVINGWPKLVPITSEGSYDKQILETAKYVDCVNFARKAKAEAIFTVGFVDRVCRPTSIYAMYNSYVGNKEIINAPLMEHEFPVSHIEIAKEKILAHLRYGH
ncbi:MAG: acetylxylan esterase [Phycisphaerales bacterium]